MFFIASGEGVFLSGFSGMYWPSEPDDVPWDVELGVEDADGSDPCVGELWL
jgi:hypothetical protein